MDWSSSSSAPKRTKCDDCGKPKFTEEELEEARQEMLREDEERLAQIRAELETKWTAEAQEVKDKEGQHEEYSENVKEAEDIFDELYYHTEFGYIAKTEQAEIDLEVRHIKDTIKEVDGDGMLECEGCHQPYFVECANVKCDYSIYDGPKEYDNEDEEEMKHTWRHMPLRKLLEFFVLNFKKYWGRAPEEIDNTLYMKASGELRRRRETTLLMLEERATLALTEWDETTSSDVGDILQRIVALHFPKKAYTAALEVVYAEELAPKARYTRKE